jgi:hypothetical protein
MPFIFLGEKLMKQYPRLILTIMMALLCIGAASPVAAQETAQVKFGHFVFGSTPVNVYVDDAVFKAENALPYELNPLEISRQALDLAAGVHTFVVVPSGETLKAPLVNPEELTLKAGHRYLLAIMGNVVAHDLHFTLIDETAAIEKMDTNLSAVDIAINNLYGIPAVDFFFEGKLFFENLAYGDYLVLQDPTAGKGSRTTPHGDAATTIFDFPDAVGGPANTLTYFGFVGKFPGTIWTDYSMFYLGSYLGKITTLDGGTISIGDVKPTSIADLGLRYRYTLTLKSDNVVDITLNQTKEGGDAYLRVYNKAGALLGENDELTLDDNAQFIYDAGLKGLALKAGTYTIEAATFLDATPGDFTLSVNAAK